ncbi:MAG: VWA domain-containing protein [Phycisphaerae bacterium]|nr:VWA domain-containing protein [Phycisphaerae bacterium]
MNLNPFESQLERLARTLTDQFGVRVICRGEEAWTDGRQIVLPSLPEPMDEALERMVVGFLDHEMAHVAFSDFGVVKRFSQRHPGCEAMLNVVEDALIERRAMERWPGVRANLDAMFRQIRDRIVQLVGQRDAFGKFCTAVYLKLSHHQDMLGLEELVAGYEDLFAWFPAIHDTDGAADLAGQVLDRWVKQQPPTKAGAPSGSDSDNPETSGTEEGATARSDPATSSDSGSESPLPASSAEVNSKEDVGGGTGEPPSDDTDPDRDDSTADGSSDMDVRSTTTPESGSAQGKAAESADGDGGPREINHGGWIGEIVAEAIAEHVAQLNTNSEYRVYTRELDRVQPIAFAGEREVAELRNRHTDVIRRLRRGLANALRSQEKRWWRDEQVRGRLSPKTLHRLCMDRPRVDVFRTRAMVQGRSTAVSILLDASGSMTRNKMEVARDALRVLLEALADLKVATEAITFTTGRDFDLFRVAQETDQDPTEMRMRYSRFANLEIGVVKQFNEPVKTGLRRLPTISGTGLTPLGEGMQIAARRLIQRPESRRILVVLTDGRAGCEACDDAAVRHAQFVAEQAIKTGIELVGVGINDESLRAIVADTIVVHRIEELPAELCKLLSRTLMKGFRHVG